MRYFSNDFGRPGEDFKGWFARFLVRCYELFRSVDDDISRQTWDDVAQPAQFLRAPGSNAPTFDDDRVCWTFSSTVTNTVSGNLQIPHSWVEGSDLMFHFHVWSDTAPGANNVSVWKLEYVLVDVGGTLPDLSVAGNWTSTTVNITHNASARIVEAKPIATISGQGKKASVIVKWKLSRLGGNGSDTAPAINVDSVDIHYLRTKDGSGAEYAQ